MSDKTLYRDLISDKKTVQLPAFGLEEAKVRLRLVVPDPSSADTSGLDATIPCFFFCLMRCSNASCSVSDRCLLSRLLSYGLWRLLSKGRLSPLPNWGSSHRPSGSVLVSGINPRFWGRELDSLGQMFTPKQWPALCSLVTGLPLQSCGEGKFFFKVIFKKLYIYFWLCWVFVAV